MNKIVEMYADGYELEEISEELICSTEKIIDGIKKFKEGSKIARGTKSFTFNDDFKEFIANRYQSGFSLYSISEDLSLSTSTVSKYLKQSGIDTKKQDNKPYEVINWHDFEQCPACKSKSGVRNIGLHNQEEANNQKPTHSFCSPCNTEWYKENGETRKVLWFTVK